MNNAKWVPFTNKELYDNEQNPSMNHKLTWTAYKT